jgi:Tfp pilus assembly protein PilV
MKAKILGITVIVLLALSIMLMAVGTITQAINQQPAAQRGEQLVSELNSKAENSSDNALVSTFVFVCPFH